MTVAAERDMGNDVHVHGRALDRRTRTALLGLLGELFPGCRLTDVRRLSGGLWAHTHALRLLRSDGAVVRLALRRYVRWTPGSGTDGECVRHASVLGALSRSRGAAGLAPRLHWSDPEGAVLDVPALLTDLLPGRSWLPTAATPRGLELVATAMTRVHSQDVDERELGDRSDFRSWLVRVLDGDRLAECFRDCEVRDDVLAALRDGAEAATCLPVVLTHGDLHPGNVLLTGRGRSLQLGGVVDWDVAGWGARGSDVGYCRADLTLAFGPGPAEAFTDSYRRQAGADAAADLQHLAWFDLLASAICWDQFEQWLPSYHAFGVVDLTVDLMHERLLEFTVSALRRGW